MFFNELSVVCDRVFTMYIKALLYIPQKAGKSHLLLKTDAAKGQHIRYNQTFS